MTNIILGSCFEVMNELGVGFLESVYKNALVINLKEKGLDVAVEQQFSVYYRAQKIGIYRADIIVDKKVIIELKCCKELTSEHKSQLINYLKATGIPLGVLVNFGKRIIEYNRLYSPDP